MRQKISSSFLSLALAVTLTGFLSGPVLAKKAEELMPIVVTATKTEKELINVPSSISVVTNDMIEAQPQSTVADLLRDIPGVQVLDGSLSGLKRVLIRGESPSRVLVLIDGQKISDQKNMSGVPLMIDQNSIERIEVIKGPASVLHGSEAIGGVVNIITKKGGDRPVQADISGTYNSAAKAITSSASIYGSANNIDYRLSGTYTDADDLRTGSGRLEDSSYMTRDLSGYLGYNWDQGSLGLKVEHFWSDLESPRVMFNPPNFIDLDLPEWKRDKIGLFFNQQDITPYIAKIQANAFYQKTKKDFRQNALFKPMTLNLTTINDQNSLGGDLQIDWTPTSSMYLITGISYLRDKLEANELMRVRPMLTPGTGAPGGPGGPPAGHGGAPGRPDGTPAGHGSASGRPGGTPGGPGGAPDLTAYYEGQQDNFALFAQTEWDLAQDWMLTLGLRQTFVKTELEKSSNPALTTGSESNNRPVGSVGLVYSGLQDWTLRALFSQGYHVPTIQQLFIGTEHGNEGSVLPNPNLDEEISNNFEVGARFNNGSFNLDTALFASKAKNYITRTTLRPGLTQFNNADKATTYGMEAQLSYILEQLGLTPYLNLTFMRRQFETAGHKTWNTDTPSLFGRTGLRYERPFTNKNITFTSDLYARFSTKAKEENSRGNVTTTPGWGTCNLALGLLFGQEKNYRLSLNINNILDKEYTEASGRLESPGAHAIVRLDMTF